VAILKDFAVNGVSIPTGKDFVPDGTFSNSFRGKYARTKEAVHSLLYDFYLKGLCLLIDVPHAVKIEGFNGSNKQSWAVKSGKPEGRQCGDVVDLNSEECRIQCEERWGRIDFPTIEDYIADVILPLADEHSFEGIDLWKQDLNGAHQLLFFAPKDARLVLIQLIAELLAAFGLVMVYLAGIFGWCGMSYAFQVVSRTLWAICKYRIKGGRLIVYADDFLGASPTALVDTHLDIVDDVARTLLGPGAISEDGHKRVTSKDPGNEDRVITALGWDVSLLGWVRPSRKNLLKALGYFFELDIQRVSQ